VDVVTFSGDKLLGGPQAGIILGKKTFLDLFKANPLTRALRIDKLTLAALESTLLLYLDEKMAMEEIPTLRMLSLENKRMTFALKEDVSQVGGGALPLQELQTAVVAVRTLDLSVNSLEENLRKGDPPIISRISKEELLLDMRTVFDEEIPLLAAGIEKALTDTAEGKAHRT
jgi:L-seryl-tRNA(Ser) seleniumtransferase